MDGAYQFGYHELILVRLANPSAMGLSGYNWRARHGVAREPFYWVWRLLEVR